MTFHFETIQNDGHKTHVVMWKCFVKKKKIDSRLKKTTLSPNEGTVLAKCCNKTKTKLFLMVFLKEARKVRLNKHAFLTKIGLNYIPNIFSLCLDIHSH